jgi:hypothetical protein
VAQGVGPEFKLQYPKIITIIIIIILTGEQRDLVKDVRKCPDG